MNIEQKLALTLLIVLVLSFLLASNECPHAEKAMIGSLFGLVGIGIWSIWKFL